ncbi:cytosolic carboxypeptidase 6 [Notolabrus celidotus]|uniref:cytosolic carboxypeptidase 6 n=1 Tax=Notolabrus celidotus TaxID=1203425 RepID=UPI0014902DBC|nr:cytosolic carboxypeptidase 6 [Notolabrus celidotus]
MEESTVRDVETGSEAGGEDALVGNVNKLMVSPPGYSGAPRKGHLVFDACFESGNLGRVDYISEFELDLFIRPDTCNPRFRVWFNFTVENVCETQRVIFNVVNFSKTKSLYRDGMSPVVKSTSRPKWQRLPAKNVYYYRCPDHRRNYVMSFAFCFDREDDVYQFAYCYPYTYSRLQHYLGSLERRNLPYLQREQLGLSVQQRRLDLLTITNLDHSGPEKEKKLVFLTSRVHPGESPASFICQGVIDFLVSQHPVAQILRDHVIFKIVPMLNPDGVYLGNYRCSLMGFDLNRHWQDPSPWAHPTLHAVKQLIVQMNQDPVSFSLRELFR